MRRLPLLALLLSSAIATAQPAPKATPPLLSITDYQLPNGLKVILHRDTSDPVVAVALTAHVGSARETPGRTGFAHLFEHLFFLDSENLGPGGLDRLSTRIGGSGANGSTNTDATYYGQEVPRDALEKLIWAEADKLGWFINTVTDAVLAKEIQVVKNEKRQSYDNQPYGHLQAILFETMFPADHPYSWTTIGSLADLDAATLADVKGFYRNWYTPQNTTLTIAGDFDPAQARTWVERYFGELKGAAQRAPIARPRPPGLTATKRLFHEDNFATLPELTLGFPSAPATDADYVALELLMEMLTAGKDAPLTKLLVDQEKLTDAVGGAHYELELAGLALLSVRTFDGIDLDRAEAALKKGLAGFEAAGIDPAALTRARLAKETKLYSELENVNAKAEAIARMEAVTGRSDGLEIYRNRLRAVTGADIMRVYRRYLKDKPHIAVSMVPKGKPELALAGSTRARIVEETIVQGAEAAVDASAEIARYAKTPSRIDRTVEPPFGPAPAVIAPPIWTATLANGLAISGITANELPMANFELSFDGGRLLDDPARPGGANLLARMLTRGTANRTPAEFDNALKALGAKLEVTAEDTRIILRGSTLARNLAPTAALVTEMLTQPRWDTAELALVKAGVASEIQAGRGDPERIAARLVDRVSFGPASILARDVLGTETSVAALQMSDLQAFMPRALAPANARLRVVGAVDEAAVTAAFASLGTNWRTPAAAVPTAPRIAAPTAPELYFYDIPDAKQSMLAIVGPGPNSADPDYYPATATNFLLGGGGFASRLTQQLREGKGYTYGVRSRFEANRQFGGFLLETPVRSNVTLEALQLARSIAGDYGASFTPADLALTRDSLARAAARRYETSPAKLRLLAEIGDNGRPADFVSRDAATLQGLTVAQVQGVAGRYLRPEALRYVVVGDAKTQAGRLEALGLGKPVMLDAKALE